MAKNMADFQEKLMKINIQKDKIWCISLVLT